MKGDCFLWTDQQCFCAFEKQGDCFLGTDRSVSVRVRKKGTAFSGLTSSICACVRCKETAYRGLTSNACEKYHLCMDKLSSKGKPAGYPRTIVLCGQCTLCCFLKQNKLRVTVWFSKNNIQAL